MNVDRDALRVCELDRVQRRPRGQRLAYRLEPEARFERRVDLESRSVH